MHCPSYPSAALSAALAAAFLPGACAPVPEPALTESQQAQLAAELADVLGDRVAGKPQNCIGTTSLGSSVPVGDRIIVYARGSVRYRNDLRSACPGLGRNDDILVTELHGTQLCDGDLVQQVDRFSGIQGPSCRLGKFTPYSKADSER